MSGFKGGCLCGAVRYESSEDPKMGGHCHCQTCRKLGGTGHSSHVGAMAESVTFTGDMSVYELTADSGNTVRRYFCPNCGSPVYGTSTVMPAMVFIRASSLDDPEVFKPQFRTFASRTPSWDHMDPALAAFDTVPPKPQ